MVGTNKPKIILISGHAQNGKDTVANMMKFAFESDGKKVMITHFADLLKYICKTFCGWNGEKDEYGRTLLQDVGTNIVRKKDPDFWVRFISQIIRMFGRKWDYVIIPDARFPNEIKYLPYHGLSTTHVRVCRNDYDNGLTEEQKDHPSETALDGVEPDETILNDSSLDSLQAKVEAWVKKELYES